MARLRAVPLALAILMVGATQPPSTVAIHVTHPLVGFTFSPSAAAYLGHDPNTALYQLVRRLRPDLVRIPVYWDDVAPDGDRLDFGKVDQLLATVRTADGRHRTHLTQVILVVGARNFGWPEVHIPGWAWTTTGGNLDLEKITSSDSYLHYLQQSFTHFVHSPALYAWQVENEPLDNTNTGFGTVSMKNGAIADEVALLKSIDSLHQVIVTTYNSATVTLDMEANSQISWLYRLLPGPQPAGHPAPALELADILGLDVYVDTPSTPLGEATIPERIGWKASTLSYWASLAAQNGKEVWITEMQGAPWNNQPGFQTEDLMESARSYSGTGVGAVLLWGVEGWLDDPAWMDAGLAAIATLRS